MWGLRATDLNQGVVYGIETPETKLDERLLTRFDYDEAFGTALNRFCVQAVDRPAADRLRQGRPDARVPEHRRHPPVRRADGREPGRAPASIRVFNQFTETFTVAELAEKVQHAGGELGIDVHGRKPPEPALRARGALLQPGAHEAAVARACSRTLLSENLIESTLGVIQRYRDRVIPDVIAPSTQWRPAPPVGQPAS